MSKTDEWNRALANKAALDKYERSIGNPNPIFAYTDGLPPPVSASFPHGVNGELSGRTEFAARSKRAAHGTDAEIAQFILGEIVSGRASMPMRSFGEDGVTVTIVGKART